MTDLMNGAYVVFDMDYREDDADVILEAIRMVKGVVAVTPQIVNPEFWAATERARLDLEAKILEVFRQYERD